MDNYIQEFPFNDPKIAEQFIEIIREIVRQELKRGKFNKKYPATVIAVDNEVNTATIKLFDGQFEISNVKIRPGVVVNVGDVCYVEAINGDLNNIYVDFNKTSNIGVSTHYHDDRYYTKSETDILLDNKADTSHTHLKSDITDFSHMHNIQDINNLQISLDNKVDISEVVTTATANKILKLNSSAKLPASITGDADTVDSYHAGNASGQIPISNGVLNSNLNADMLDGVHLSSLPQLSTSNTFTNSNLIKPSSDSTTTFRVQKSDGSAVLDVDTTNKRVGILTETPDQPLTVNGNIKSTGQIISTVATGTAPFTVSSTTKVSNLNADKVDDYDVGNSANQIPVSNGTVNTNLNADMVDGLHSSSLVQTSGNQTISGNKTFSGDVYSKKLYVYNDGSPIANLGNPTVAEMALFQEEFNNKLEFYDITKFTFEYTTDGSNWINVTSSVSDTDKKKFVGGDASSNIVIPNGTLQYRITIRNNGNYVYLNALYMYFSTNGHSMQVHIWKKRDDGDWVQHTSSTTTVSGWPGHLYLPFSTIPWSLSSTSGHYNEVRIVFIPTWNGSYPSNNISLMKLQLWGGYPAGKRTIYTVDENKNVTFPANITATNQLISSVSTGTPPLVVNSTSKVVNLNADLLDDKHASDFVQIGSNNQSVNLVMALNQQIDTRNTVLSYDDNGNLISVVEKDGSTTVKTTTLNYDGNGILTSVVEQVGGKTITTTLNYDGDGNLIGINRSVV